MVYAAFIALVALAAAVFMYVDSHKHDVVCGIGKTFEVDFTFSYVHKADEACNRLKHYFYINRSKYFLKRLRRDGFWKDHVTIRYKLADSKAEPIDFGALVGDLLDEQQA